MSVLHSEINSDKPIKKIESVEIKDSFSENSVSSFQEKSKSIIK